MSCANLYDWIQQSPEHKRYAMTNYPVAWDLARTSMDYPHFVTRARDIRSGRAGQYMDEYNRWWKRWGEAWDKLGCKQEYVLGEHTGGVEFSKKPIPHRGLRQVDYLPYVAEGPRMNVQGLAGMGNISCFTGECGMGAVDDWETGTSDIYDDDWWSGSDSVSTGTPSEFPTLKSGYFWCNKPPSEIKMVSSPKASTVTGWTVAVYSGVDNQLYYRYDHAGTNARKWACPRSSSSSAATKTDVTAIQKALNSAGYPPGPIDGIVGSKTCAAAYKYAAQRLNQYGGDLSAQFFNSLGIGGRNFDVKYARLCTIYYNDVGQQKPTSGGGTTPSKPDTTKPKDEPKDEPAPNLPSKAGFPLWLGVVLGGGAVVGALYYKARKGR